MACHTYDSFLNFFLRWLKVLHLFCFKEKQLQHVDARVYTSHVHYQARALPRAVMYMCVCVCVQMYTSSAHMYTCTRCIFNKRRSMLHKPITSISQPGKIIGRIMYSTWDCVALGRRIRFSGVVSSVFSSVVLGKLDGVTDVPGMSCCVRMCCLTPSWPQGAKSLGIRYLHIFDPLGRR